MKNFWNTLKKPFVALAPMEDVTDAAFRRVIATYGKPDVFFTEFTSADGLDSDGYERVAERLIYSEVERPIVAQLWTAHPNKMEKAAAMVAGLGFDGIDINMGCPDRAVCKGGAGAALMENPSLAMELITAAKASGLPVSVKTRTGWDRNNIDAWIGTLLDAGLAAITIHARTKKELSLVPAHWEEVKQAVELAKGSGTLIIGNGDLQNLQEAKEKCIEIGADGAMLGRAIIGNPWLFSGRTDAPSLHERLMVMIEHAELYQELFEGRKNFTGMKKHLHAYATGFDGAKQLRIALMQANSTKGVQEIIACFQNTA